MTAAQVASWVGGTIEAGSEGTPVEAVSIDSRTLVKGELFFAIVGPHHDGHRYVDQAVARGAVGVVVSDDNTPVGSGVTIRVGDTTRALQELASAVRRVSGIMVVAITGSMGKTTTKEAAAVALSSRFRVLKSEKNLNNQYGLPLSLLRHRNEEVAVLELGMSAPGEIARLTEIARPDVGVLTNVAEVHREFFPSLAAIANAKGELFNGLPDDAIAVVNVDDPLVVEQSRRFPGRQIGYGLGEPAEVSAKQVTRIPEGLRFVAGYESEQVEVEAPLYGKHNVYNLLAALAVAVGMGIPLIAAAAKLSALGPPPHRGERLRFQEGFLVIDETYNSNPRALAALLELLAEEEAARRIAVVGDMLELGERAEAAHLEIGHQAAANDLALLLGVGKLGRLIVEGARRGGMAESRLAFVESAEEAGEWIANCVEAGDVVLFKASRGVGLDRALEVLKARFRLEVD
jgi:UDP-N-acetylmuramoyl-tripeptide--D-alanyl-D-alanine ligase